METITLKEGEKLNYNSLYEQLKKRQAELEKRLQENGRFGLEQSTRDSTGELSLYDNHPADIGTELFERGKDIALHEMVEREYEEVTEAIKKIENGTYGICEVTGKQIPYERLKANPTAKTVVEHATRNSNPRPVEEDVLQQFDDQNETLFDGEDAYQAVARFNENEMTFEDASLIEDDLIGSVEQVEGFLSNGIEGYKGIDEVEALRNTNYDHYIDQ